MPVTLDPPDATEAKQTVTKPQRGRPAPIDPAIIETAKGLFLQGVPLVAIAEKLNVQPVTVRSWSFRQRWPMLVSKVNQVQQLGRVTMSVSAMPAVQSEQSTRLRSMLATEVESQAMALASVPPRPGDLPNTPERQGRAAVLKTLVDAASVIHDWDSQHTPGIVLVGEVERMIEQSETPINIDSRVEQSVDAPDTTTGSVPE